MSVLFKGGTVVNATGRYVADVYADGDKIKAIGTDLDNPADEVIDAGGKYILPGAIDPTFFGIVNLANPNMVIAFLAGIFQFIQVKMATPKPKEDKKKDSSFAGQMQKQMLYFMPAFMVLILFRLPSAVGLYWLTTTLFTIIQQYVILKKEND